MKRFSTILLILHVFLFTSLHSQDLSEAKEHFNNGNFLSAIISYRLHLADHPDDKNALKNIGLCYLNSNIDKSKSIRYFKKCLAFEKYDKEILYYLALAYSYNLDFEKALKFLRLYELKPGRYKKEIPILFERFNFAQTQISSPKNVEIENLGDKVNTSFEETNPFIDKKERILVFSSNRKGNKGIADMFGNFYSDIYTNNFTGFNFSRSKNCKSLNGNFHDECTGIKDDGSYIYVTVKHPSFRQQLDVFKSKKRGRVYKRKELLNQGLNSLKFNESSGTFNMDENIIFFSSDRPGGLGGNDIYIMKKLPNGQWGEAENLYAINSELNEEFPYFNSFDSCLYFSSNGLPGIGQYDLFKTKLNTEENVWSDPENLGFPINSPYDEKTICFSRKNKHAYISSLRKGGLGNYDIYRINYKDVILKPVIFLMSVKEDSTLKSIDSVEIEINSTQSNVIYGKYLPNKNNGLFTVAIDPGKYQLKISSPTHQTVLKKFNVSNFDYDKEIIRQTHLLKPKTNDP